MTFKSGPFSILALFAIFRLFGYITDAHVSVDEIHRHVGEPARTGALNRSGPLTLVTWNIERGVRFDRIVETLRKLNPDIVLLQEVDRFCRRSGTRDVARNLADALDMNWISAAEFQEIGQGRGGMPALTGQAILSKSPIDDPTVMVFTQQARWRWRLNPAQPRRGGRIALRARTAGMLFYNVHLESGSNDPLRERQFDQVLMDEARTAADRTVIAGDFNSSAAARPALLARVGTARFTDALGAVDGRRTSTRVTHPIDWMFVKGIGSSNGRVERVENASDHYPLVATLTPSE